MYCIFIYLRLSVLFFVFGYIRRFVDIVCIPKKLVCIFELLISTEDSNFKFIYIERVRRIIFQTFKIN